MKKKQMYIDKEKLITQAKKCLVDTNHCEGCPFESIRNIEMLCKKEMLKAVLTLLPKKDDNSMCRNALRVCLNPKCSCHSCVFDGLKLPICINMLEAKLDTILECKDITEKTERSLSNFLKLGEKFFQKRFTAEEKFFLELIYREISEETGFMNALKTTATNMHL